MFQIFIDVPEEFAALIFRAEEYGKDRKIVLT
jgi:hypothetical protein